MQGNVLIFIDDRVDNLDALSASWSDFGDVQVITPAPNVAVIAYTVEQRVEMDGKTRDLRAADSSTVR